MSSSSCLVDDSTTCTNATTTTILSLSSTISQGGFDYEFQTTDSRFECPICLLYMRDPVITSCGHRFCSGCISQWVLNQTNPNGCPVDGGILSHENIFPDNFTRREILACKVKCPYVKDGCKVILPLAEMEKHVESHHSNLSGSSSSVNGTVECIFRDMGCVSTFHPEGLSRHLETDVHYHLQLCTASYKRLKKMLSNPDHPSPHPDYITRQDSRDSTRWLLFDDRDSDDYNFRRQRSWDSVRFARRCNSRQQHHPDRLAESDESLTKHTHAASNSHKEEAGCSSGLQSKLHPASHHHNGHNHPCNSSPLVNGEENQLKDLFARIVVLEQNDREKQIKIDRLESQLSSAVDLFTKFTCLMDDLKFRYCNGSFVWKLTNFSDLCKDMRKNRSQCKTSAGFYTDSFGYKLCLRFGLSTQTQELGATGGSPVSPIDVPLHLDENYFVSLHIHFVEGDFDDTLKWPFNGDFSITVVNPSKPDESVTEFIRSKPEALAFIKATKPNPYGFGLINPVGIGHLYVCSLKKLFSTGFVQNDSLTVKIIAKAQQGTT